jgi:hypothetical protein
MDQPLVGNREQNYRFFYVGTGSAVCSLFMLLIITGYTAYISTHVGDLITDMNIVIGDFETIMPQIKNSLSMLGDICKHENFTKSYGDVCSKPTFLID